MSRLQVALSDQSMKCIDDLVALVGMSSRAALIENSITMLAWALREVRKGNVIGAIPPGGEGYTELVMPCLMVSSHEATKNDKARSPRALKEARV